MEPTWNADELPWHAVRRSLGRPANGAGCVDESVGSCGSITIEVQDLINPSAVRQNITVHLDGSGNASRTSGDIDGGSTDNCSNVTLGASQTAFTSADIGANNVTLTVTDASSNTATCTAIVTVKDTTSGRLDISTSPGVAHLHMTDLTVGQTILIERCFDLPLANGVLAHTFVSGSHEGFWQKALNPLWDTAYYRLKVTLP